MQIIGLGHIFSELHVGYNVIVKIMVMRDVSMLEKNCDFINVCIIYINRFTFAFMTADVFKEF